MPKRFLSHNRASELPDGACRLFYSGLCDINKLTDACSTLNFLPSSFWLYFNLWIWVKSCFSIVLWLLQPMSDQNFTPIMHACMPLP